MEMPVDILNQRLGKIRDNGDIDFDNTAAAVDIDSELQEKFLFFPIEELEALEEQIEFSRDVYYLGQNHGYAVVHEDAPLTELYQRAENTLALYWHLKRKAEEKEAEEAEKMAKLAKRPLPGVYRARSGVSWFTMIVTEDRRILIPQQLSDRHTDFTDDYDNGKVNWTDQRQINVADGTVQ